MLGNAWSTFPELTHLILSITPLDKYYYQYHTWETEVLKSLLHEDMATGVKADLKPGWLALRPVPVIHMVPSLAYC